MTLFPYPTSRKVIVSREEVQEFMRQFPCSGLQDRSYWFEFDDEYNLVDSDVPHQDDGPGALALSQQAADFLREQA